MNIYLDIDGVILVNDKQPTRHVRKFLDFCTRNFPTYWLTTHCKGDAEHTIQHLSNWLDKKSLELAKRITATSWEKSKTEALDYNTPFLWFDDYLFDFEKQELKKHNALKNWVEVDLSKDPNYLKYVVKNFDKLLEERGIYKK